MIQYQLGLMHKLNTMSSRYTMKGYDQNEQAETQERHERKHGQHPVVFIN
jgi:hypothetical protein